jgi:hypothetical protein
MITLATTLIPDESLFEKYLQQLQDSALVGLSRHYLGDLLGRKEKRELIPKILNFVQSDQQQERLFALLDASDLQVLHAVHFCWQLQNSINSENTSTHALGKTPQALLASLLYPMRKQPLAVALNNLRDRLWLIYDAQHQLCLNPYLAGKLLPILQEHPLFFSETLPAEELQRDVSLTFDLSMMQALLTIIHQCPRPATLRNDISEYLCTSLSQSFLEELLETLKSLCLISDQNTLQISHLCQFCNLAPQQQLARLYAALIFAHSSQSLELYALESLLTLLFTKEDLLLPESTLLRLYAFFSKEQKNSSIASLTPILLHYNIISSVQTRSDTEAHYRIVSAHFSQHPIKVESDFSFYYPPDQTLCLPIILGTRLQQFDVFSKYQIDKDQFIKSKELGYDTASMRDFFTSCSHVPEQLGENIDYWLSSHETLIIYQGYLLQIQQPYLHLSHNDVFLDRFIQLRLSDELLLLKEAPTAHLYDFLASLGISQPRLYQLDSLPSNSVEPADNRTQNLCTSYLGRCLLEQLQPMADEAPTPSVWHAPDFYKEIDSPHSRLLVERKLIISPDQLAHLKNFRHQTSGLDFQAKMRLVELAIKEHKDLLVQVRDASGEKELYLLPLKFDKKETLQLKAYDYRLQQTILFHSNAILHLEVVKRNLLP